MKRWKICVSNPFQNCELVYPIQQKKIAAMIDHFQDNENVRKVVIFGSSVKNNCHVGSDIDLYVELAQNRNPISKAFDFTYDLWTNFTVSPEILNAVKREGVVVYEK